jgi:hypothetical protein
MELRIRSFAHAACLCIVTVLLTVFVDGQTKTVATRSAATTCANAPVLSSDGTVTSQDFLLLASTNYYTLNATAGHSYSVDVWDPLDPTYGVSPAISVLASDCSTTVSVTDVTSVDPDLSGGFSARVSWIQAANATVHIALANPDQDNNYTYYLRVTDTTLFNPRWTTYSGFSTQWGLTNTTGSDLVGNFTVVNLDGTVLKTVTNAAVKTGVTTFFYSSSLGLPAEHVDSAVFAYIGPPGALAADAYYLNGNATVVVPALFVSKHSSR